MNVFSLDYCYVRPSIIIVRYELEKKWNQCNSYAETSFLDYQFENGNKNGQSNFIMDV